jgi:hypothetical protein
VASYSSVKSYEAPYLSAIFSFKEALKTFHSSAADANKDGKLTAEEWKVFSASLKEKMAERYGASYDLTEE